MTYRASPISGPHIRLANYFQWDEHSCAFIAALTLAQHFYPEVSPKEVLSVIRPTMSAGLDGGTMRKRLKLLGIATSERTSLTTDSLRRHVERGTTVLLTVWPDEWPTDHWTVVKGFDRRGERIYLSNFRSMTLADFRAAWFPKGYGLVCGYGNG